MKRAATEVTATSSVANTQRRSATITVVARKMDVVGAAISHLDKPKAAAGSSLPQALS